MTRNQKAAVLAAVGAAGIAAGVGVLPVIAAGAVIRALCGPDRVPDADPIKAKKDRNGSYSTPERRSPGGELGAWGGQNA